MEAIVTRPAVSCCRRAVAAPGTAAPSRLLFLTTSTVLPSGTRQKSTSARTRRALNIPPHPSFLDLPTTGAGKPAADGTTPARPTTDQIIFNPPSSAPSVLHTPFKFLPKSDPRRRANLASSLLAASTTLQYPSNPQPDASASASAAAAVDALPVVNPAMPTPRHHLSMADIEEMRALRAADPATHSVQALSKRFQCSKLFVLMCCQAPKEHRDKIAAEADKVKARWGPRRRQAREERGRRFEMLYRGEL